MSEHDEITARRENDRPTAGEVENRTAAVEVEDKRIRGLIPYGVESRDLGGWTEVIEPTAFRNTRLDELRAVIDHAGVPLGRYPQTLDVEDAPDGLRWSLDPPRSRADVVEAVQRGDMRAGSWRMQVARDEWRGNVRHVHEIAELKDVTLVGAAEPAYPAAAVEYRTTSVDNNGGSAAREEGTMPDQKETGAADRDVNDKTASDEERTQDSGEERAEDRSEARSNTAGSLRVEERTSEPPRGLMDEFRAAGFPDETAEIVWADYESRAVTWTPSISLLDQTDRAAASLGFDQRYAWTALPRVGVDAGVTSVQFLTQTSRSLASAASVIRGIAATGAKAETTTTINLTSQQLSGVASVESGIPNVILEQDAVNSIVETDLRLAVNEGLDKLAIDTFAASGFQAPGSDNLVVSVRKALTTLDAAGYAADTLILTPAASESLDLLVSGITGGSADFVFPPGQPAPGIWGLRRVISKTAAAPVVLDSSAYAKLYASPVSLARFEENDGSTNTSLVRLELHASVGVERQSAAIRIAAS